MKKYLYLSFLWAMAQASSTTGDAPPPPPAAPSADVTTQAPPVPDDTLSAVPPAADTPPLVQDEGEDDSQDEPWENLDIPIDASFDSASKRGGSSVRRSTALKKTPRQTPQHLLKKLYDKILGLHAGTLINLHKASTQHKRFVRAASATVPEKGKNQGQTLSSEWDNYHKIYKKWKWNSKQKGGGKLAHTLVDVYQRGEKIVTPADPKAPQDPQVVQAWKKEAIQASTAVDAFLKKGWTEERNNLLEFAYICKKTYEKIKNEKKSEKFQKAHKKLMELFEEMLGKSWYGDGSGYGMSLDYHSTRSRPGEDLAPLSGFFTQETTHEQIGRWDPGIRMG